MNRFHLFLFLAFLLFTTPRIEAIRPRSFSSPSARNQQVFHPWESAPIGEKAGEFESEKRRVPTGSNPLHNKR
ncbi:hypothetical protein L1049_024022 [Liquidambar formosana]|uniref:Uncharacterized protein n=1 Tax=Liquidambar formosana TaxID=63359 RepID=A0AAP0WZ73_LIQFO